MVGSNCAQGAATACVATAIKVADRKGANMNEDEIKGAAKDVSGKVKDATDSLTGDAGLQAEGKMDQASGKLQGKFGDVRDQLGEAAGIIPDKASELTMPWSRKSPRTAEFSA
jgi:uncharacterized protein YjbJ (UPF0337 family)